MVAPKPPVFKPKPFETMSRLELREIVRIAGGLVEAIDGDLYSNRPSQSVLAWYAVLGAALQEAGE